MAITKKPVRCRFMWVWKSARSFNIKDAFRARFASTDQHRTDFFLTAHLFASEHRL